MKFTLTEEEHGKLPEAMQGEYEKSESGAFVLKLEGHEEHLVPKAKKDLAEQHRKAAEAKIAEIEKAQAKLLEDLEKAKGSEKKIEEIRANAQAEIEKAREESKAELEKIKKENHSAMIRETASKFASEHSTVPTLFADAFAKRLTVEEVEGTPVIRVLGEDGKASALSLDQLQKDFLAKEEFKPIIKASNASGGGANPGQGGKPGSAQKTITKDQLDSMSQDERHSFFVRDGGKVEG
jgi:glutaredoxin